MRARLALGILFLLIAVPSWAQSQSVRVLAAEAAVRLNPEQQSTVLVTVPVGTVLELGGEQRGEWYPVILPPDASGLRRSGYVLATAVEPLSKLSVLNQPLAPSPTPRAAAANSLAEWQWRYDQALAKRRAGRAKFWSGWGVFTAGAFLHAFGQRKDCVDWQTPYIPGQGIFFGRDCVTHSEPMKWAGIGTEIGGLTLVIWGGNQTADANKQLKALEATKAVGGVVSFSAGLKGPVELQASSGVHSLSVALAVRW